MKSSHMRKRELGRVVKSWSMLSKRERERERARESERGQRDVDGVIAVGRMVQHTDMRWEWRVCYSSRYSWGLGGVRAVHRVRNGILDVQCKSGIRMGFRLIKPEETITG